MKSNRKVSRKMSKSILFIISCYLASLIALLVGLYMIFFSNIVELQTQGVYWFLIAIVCFVLPFTGPIIDRVNNLRFGDFEVNMVQIQQTVSMVEIVFRVEGYLANATSSDYDEIKLTNDILRSPARSLNLIYASVLDFREKNVYSILRANNVDERRQYREQFTKLIPVLVALTQTRNADLDKRHDYFAQLAYVYKDLPIPQWEQALEAIEEAIRYRGNQGNLKYGIYEFNRLLCKLNLNKKTPGRFSDEELRKDFYRVNDDGASQFMLYETNLEIAPGLYGWINQKGNEDIKEAYNRWFDEKESRSR